MTLVPRLRRAFAFQLLLMLMLSLLAPTVVAAERLTGGPMPGYLAMRSAVIWLQASGTSDAQIEYWPEGKPSERWKTEAVELLTESDYSAHIQIDDLQPGHTYEYRVLIDGQPQPGGESPWRFRTAPLWKWRADPPAFTLALGSCAYINDEPYDRPGKPYGGDYQIFDSIAALKPDLMLWAGDNIYLREVDFDNPAGMNYRYRHVRSFAPLQRLLQGTHHVATWDDHDFGSDNANSSFPLKGTSLVLFKRYWGNPSYGLPETPGVFTTFSYADADFFLLDDRYHRDHDAQPDVARRQMLGGAQLRWLKNALMASDANFKLIVNGSQLLMGNRGSEGWKNFPNEREDFLDWLNKSKVPGVFFISGDRHLTKMARVPREGRYALQELTCSPLTSGVRDPAKDEPSPNVIKGTVVGVRNFCTINFSGPAKERVMTLRSHDSNGTKLWERIIGASELR
jgi:alkaline phosphatase D